MVPCRIIDLFTPSVRASPSSAIQTLRHPGRPPQTTCSGGGHAATCVRVSPLHGPFLEGSPPLVRKHLYFCLPGSWASEGKGRRFSHHSEKNFPLDSQQQPQTKKVNMYYPLILCHFFPLKKNTHTPKPLFDGADRETRPRNRGLGSHWRW